MNTAITFVQCLSIVTCVLSAPLSSLKCNSKILQGSVIHFLLDSICSVRVELLYVRKVLWCCVRWALRGSELGGKQGWCSCYTHFKAKWPNWFTPPPRYLTQIWFFTDSMRSKITWWNLIFSNQIMGSFIQYSMWFLMRSQSDSFEMWPRSEQPCHPHCNSVRLLNRSVIIIVCRWESQTTENKHVRQQSDVLHQISTWGVHFCPSERHHTWCDQSIGANFFWKMI